MISPADVIIVEAGDRLRMLDFAQVEARVLLAQLGDQIVVSPYDLIVVPEPMRRELPPLIQPQGNRHERRAANRRNRR